MQLFGIRTELVQPGDNLVDMVLGAMKKQTLDFKDLDILAIASKALAISQNRLKKLDSVKPTEKARELGKRYGLKPALVEIILGEADMVYGGVSKTLLTLKDHILTANAGVDQKNSPEGYVVLWPKAPFRAAKQIRSEISKMTCKHAGVLVVDSRVTPLRMGTTGVALAVAGFEPVRDYRVEKDLFGRSISVTRHALADDLAAAAHAIMGESNERTPAVLIRDAKVQPADRVRPSSLTISVEECLFASHMTLKNVKKSS